MKQDATMVGLPTHLAIITQFCVQSERKGNVLPYQGRAEIDHRTMKLIVGVIALSLASLTSRCASTPIASISASYYETGVSHVIFIGFLFAISAFLLAYNGYTRLQMILSKVAGIATLCIALFPCGCDGHEELVPYVHFASAAVTFAILAFFCYVFFQRAIAKSSGQAKSRAFIYAICGVVIVLVMIVLAINRLGHMFGSYPRLTYYGEKTALVAFGVSWLTASHWLPVITTQQERIARRNRQTSEVVSTGSKETAHDG
jgi:hypothetical protein